MRVSGEASSDKVTAESHSQEAQAKDTHENEPVLLGEVERPKGRERQSKDDDVGEDISARVNVPLRDVGDAFGGHRLVPEAVDGVAGEDANEHLRQGPAADEHDARDIDYAHALHGQDAVVLEEKGHLDEEQRPAVHDDGHVKALRRRVSIQAGVSPRFTETDLHVQ